MKELKISLDIYVEITDGETEDSIIDRIANLLEKQNGVNYQIYETEEQDI